MRKAKALISSFLMTSVFTMPMSMPNLCSVNTNNDINRYLSINENYRKNFDSHSFSVMFENTYKTVMNKTTVFDNAKYIFPSMHEISDELNKSLSDTLFKKSKCKKMEI